MTASVSTEADPTTRSIQQKARTGGLFSPDHRALSGGLVLIMTLVALEALAVATAMPVVQRDLGGLRLYGLVFSAFMVSNIIGITVGGRFADTEGPRRPFVVALILFAVGLTIAGLAPSMGVLVAARAVQGLGAGTISTTVYVVIGRKYDEGLRPRMFALLASAWVVPGLVGPGLAAFVAETLTWRLVFLGLLPLLPLVAALTLPSMSHLGPVASASSAPSDLRMIGRLALGAALCLAGFASAVVLAAVPLVIVGVVICGQPVQRLLPEGTFQARRGLPAAVAAVALLTLGFGGSQTFVPLMLTEVRGQSPALAGIALSATTVTWALGSWIQERKSGTASPVTIVTIGMLCGSASLIAGLLVDLSLLAPPAVVVGWSIGGLGMGLAYPTLSLTILKEAGPDRAGSASASLQLASVLAGAIGAAAGGAVISLGESLGWATSTSIATIFIALLATVGLGLVVSRRVSTEASEESGLEAVPS
jgi:MFS family permease